MNLDLIKISFVIPFYRRLEFLRAALPKNAIFTDPRVEVVLVLDEPSQELEIVEDLLPKLSHLLRVRVVVNDWEHPWRPPCSAINVGIRHARAPYIAVTSPESIVTLPRQNYLFERIRKEECDGRFFLTGWHFNIPRHSISAIEGVYGSRADAFKERFSHKKKRPYGFILFSREDAFMINGYDERRQNWGGDDDDFRDRLEKSGVRRVADPRIEIMHIWSKSARRKPNDEPIALDIIIPNQENFGLSFGRVAYDYLKLDHRNSSLRDL